MPQRKNSNRSSKPLKRPTHLDEKGRARMVDVSGKPPVFREAVAKGSVHMDETTIEAVKEGNVPKGDVIAVSRVAGIMAAKKTPDIVPLCHPINLSSVSIDFELGRGKVEITSKVSCVGQTGVEMEALTAVSAAALAIYDMCKAIDKGMSISEIRLVKKTKKPVL